MAFRPTGCDTILQLVFLLIKPVYIHLTNKTLLQCHLCGAMQKRNESLNGLIWQLYPKETFCGATTVETAAAMVVALFSNGSVALQRILTAMNCPVGVYTAALACGLDDNRVYHAERKDSDRVYHAERKASDRVYYAERKASEREKSSRKRRRRIRKGVEEKCLNKKGSLVRQEPSKGATTLCTPTRCGRVSTQNCSKWSTCSPFKQAAERQRHGSPQKLYIFLICANFWSL